MKLTCGVLPLAGLDPGCHRSSAGKKNNYVPLQCWELQNWIQSHMATPDGYLPFADTTLAEHLISTLGRGVLWMQWVGLSSWPGESFKSKYVSTLFGDNHWNVYIYIYNKYIIYNLYIYWKIVLPIIVVLPDRSEVCLGEQWPLLPRRYNT